MSDHSAFHHKSSPKHAKGRILLRELALSDPIFRRSGVSVTRTQLCHPSLQRDSGQNPHVPFSCRVSFPSTYPSSVARIEFRCRSSRLAFVPLSSLKDFSSVASEYATTFPCFNRFISVQIGPELCISARSHMPSSKLSTAAHASSPLASVIG